MIPNIGMMIGGYIIFRCIELSCRAESHFAGPGARAAVVILATLGVLVTGFLTIDLAMTGSSQGLQQLIR
jgi:hypothetical protein